MTDPEYIAKLVATGSSCTFALTWFILIAMSELPSALREGLKIGSIAHLGNEKQVGLMMAWMSIPMTYSFYYLALFLYNIWTYDSANTLWVTLVTGTICGMGFTRFFWKLDGLNQSNLLKLTWVPSILIWWAALIAVCYYQTSFPMMDATVNLFGSDLPTWQISLAAGLLSLWPLVIRPAQFMDIKCGDESKTAGKADPLLMGLRNRNTVVMTN
eukprot:gnl/MRDRNA2_/MRDRNA2_79679_c1_seq1.p1 gnl/MRDRNA2_/MRDRNA2_79679_c1~~gnl/MRDRNA2_/MRDRNA2_79679_c1_seq1.p1  ORF type:complete len:214 (+),score=17.01 gnl/MRDRNA2_/MRDRNA2_79679_c1_seq1:66-707(+)